MFIFSKWEERLASCVNKARNVRESEGWDWFTVLINASGRIYGTPLRLTITAKQGGSEEGEVGAADFL